jgi:hypothetical protein
MLVANHISAQGCCNMECSVLRALSVCARVLQLHSKVGGWHHSMCEYDGRVGFKKAYLGDDPCVC